MKRFLIAAMILLFAIGCGAPKEGTIILPYPKPADFDHFEVFVGLAPGFTVTGWDGAAWVGEPNAPADWDGVTNTLKVISSTEPIAIPGLISGVRYYVRVVAVDTSNNRSAPSVQYDAMAGISIDIGCWIDDLVCFPYNPAYWITLAENECTYETGEGSITIIKVSGGGTTAGAIRLRGAMAISRDMGVNGHVVEFRAKLVMPTSGQIIRLGLLDEISRSTFAAYFTHSPDDLSKILCFSNENVFSDATQIIIDWNEFHIFKIETDSSTTRFFIDGDLVATHNINCAVYGRPSAYIESYAPVGGNDYSFELDWFAYRMMP